MGACQSLLMFIKNYLPSVEKEKRLFEIKRKFFHLLGLFFPVLTIFCDNGKLLIISCILTVVMIVFDYNNLLLLFLNKVPVVGYALKRLLRRSENRKHHFCGLTWLFIGYSIILASYEQYLVVIAMTIFVFCDMSSALIGKNFGKFKICGDKTFEGFIAFIISGCFVIYLFITHVNNVAGFSTEFLFVSLFVTAVVELFSKQMCIDDNFSIPLSFCASYKILENCF